MKKIIELITDEMEKAFEEAGIDKELARVSVSNRPDLCEYQCNGAMAAAKVYHKAPIVIAGEIIEKLKKSKLFEEVTAVNPGFINVKLSKRFLSDFLIAQAADGYLGVSGIGRGKTIVMDYGGPNVAKPLHIGHLRAAIIGESLKRIYRYNGYKVIGDVHLGDWGLQMGLIMEETKVRRPELPYFDPDFKGEYPSEAPFTISDLEEIYPAASAKAKENEEFADAAHKATAKLQNGDPGYTALFRHIINISVSDLKKNYKNLGVDFDVWNGESDAQPFIPEMLDILKKSGLLHESEGAMVVDVSEPDDAKEIPPCIVIKSDGASLYATTDLATLLQREKEYHPDGILYVVDKRQAMHFVQVFRTARKAGIIKENTWLFHLGFGTMNGKDGKPFKTRSGGVMRLENLIADTNEAVYNRMKEGGIDLPESEARDTAKMISIAAIKYGDLSNQATKDYIFDLDKFTSFEGNTGPYILYTIVRIKSILKKYQAVMPSFDVSITKSDNLLINEALSDSEKSLQLSLAKANDVIENAALENAPHKICQYIYEIANAFNSFYHETKILSEADENKKAGFIALLKLTGRVLNDCITMLGFEAPERM